MTLNKNFKTILIVSVALVFGLIMNISWANAAVGLGISGGDNVKGGDTFTVSVRFSGGEIGRVDGSLSYDVNKLTYISGGSSKGNSGYIQLTKGGEGGDVVFNIKFQAKTDGATELKGEAFEVYDINDSLIGSGITTTKTVNISGNADADELITEEREEPPEEVTEPVGVDEFEDVEVHAVEEKESPINKILIGSIIVLALAVGAVAIALVRKNRQSDK